MSNRIVLNTISHHGKGAIAQIVNELNARGFKKAFVCSDPDLIRFGVTGKVTRLLDEANIPYAVFSDMGTVVEVTAIENDWLCLLDGTFIFYEGGRFARKN